MRLEDDAIVLRPFEAADAAGACRGAGSATTTISTLDSHALPVHGGATHGSSSPDTERAFAGLAAATGELLGGIGARQYGPAIVEIGYWVKADARGRGVAHAGAARWSRAGRLKSWARPASQLNAEPDNVASQRVAEKAGFRREGLLRSCPRLKGTRRDAVMYSLLPEDL